MKDKHFFAITFSTGSGKPTYLPFSFPLSYFEVGVPNTDWATPTCDRANAIWRRAHTL